MPRLPDLLPSNSLLLSEQLRSRIDELRSQIIRANYNTQFAQTAPELTGFRYAVAVSPLIDKMDDDGLSESFRKTVPLTTYDSYAPFTARFFEKPCRASAILNLLAPGLPDCLIHSTSTSGGLLKDFPRYDCMAKIRSPDAGPWGISDPLRRRTTALIYWLAVDRVVVVDEDDIPVTTIYRTTGSVIGRRMNLCLDPERDEERMGTFVLDHAAPYATGFIKKWRSFLLIHALFTVSSRSIETMHMVFINTLVDLIRHFDTEFDLMVNCIANGTIPDLDGMAEVRRYLELNIFPDPERAEELRSLGRPSSCPGWCGHVWPHLRSITTIASGAFASSVPLARWFLGPNVDIRSYGYASAEAWIGLPYNPLELNQYKLSGTDLIEFLDAGKGDLISSLAQPWEVEPGTQYELVVTTRNGLWRYRLGDVVEICGFDPTDGVPVFKFIERRNVAIRFPNFMVTEKELRVAMWSLVPNITPKVVNWTAIIDDRHVLATIGFFVELSDGQISASDLSLAPQRVLDELIRSNERIAWAVARGVIRKPTIRLVRPGTFSDFLQLKIDEGSGSLGQIKVPVVLPKAEYITWFLDRVTQELGPTS